MTQPDFFVLGAPKCGTSALSTYLAEHPQIFLAPLKEPTYFAFDFPSRQKVKNLDEYLHLFRAAGPHHRVVGDYSVHYLRSSVAAEQILKFRSDAKMIVMLRNPLDILPSYHNQMLLS